jgi:hypothetical protein
MAKKLISEILESAAMLDSQEGRREYLKDNYSVALITILKGGFDESVTWNLPKGVPPYRKDDAPKGLEPTTLYRQQKMFGKYFMKGGRGDSLTPVKREGMFINMLECLHPDEAELVLAMVSKEGLTGRYKGITLKLVQDTFPALIPVVKKPKAEKEEKVVAKKKVNKKSKATKVKTDK